MVPRHFGYVAQDQIGSPAWRPLGATTITIGAWQRGQAWPEADTGSPLGGGVWTRRNLLMAYSQDPGWASTGSVTRVATVQAGQRPGWSRVGVP